jgi:hypothetical protein
MFSACAAHLILSDLIIQFFFAENPKLSTSLSTQRRKKYKREYAGRQNITLVIL